LSDGERKTLTHIEIENKKETFIHRPQLTKTTTTTSPLIEDKLGVFSPQILLILWVVERGREVV
jgi:hypothetical protein